MADPTTHGTPDRTQTEADPVYGTVTIDVWERLHTQPAPTIELTVIRVSLGRLPRREQPPKPLWLAWHGGALPADLRTLQRWYQRRFAIEHAFRFLKQDLGWTAIRPRAPQTADRWSWLLAAGLWELWLARAVVADQRLPWERPLAAGTLSPGRVRRGFAGLLLTLGTPARPPRPRGKAPGRQRGAVSRAARRAIRCSAGARPRLPEPPLPAPHAISAPQLSGLGGTTLSKLKILRQARRYVGRELLEAPLGLWRRWARRCGARTNGLARPSLQMPVSIYSDHFDDPGHVWMR